MRALLRFSSAVAFSRDKRQRWRQLCVMIASCIATFMMLIAFGLVSLSVVNPIRAGAVLGVATIDESGIAGQSTDSAVVALVERGTLAMGRQVPTVWIEPMPGHEHDPAAVPPGLDRLPRPGEAVLSPALVKAGYSAEDLGWVSSSAGSGADGSIGNDGLAAASEPLIFVRPAQGTTLGEGGAITYIESFAESDPNAVHGGYAMDPEIVTTDMMAPGVIVFLMIPAVVLLVSSSRARSLVRDQRLRFLYVLGVRPTRARLAMASETGLLAVVGALSGAAIHALVGRHIGSIPATSIRLFHGDLFVPWWAYITATCVITVVAMLCGALGRMRPRQRRTRTRTAHLSTVIALALALAIVVLSASRWVSPNVANIAYSLATIAVIVALPFAIPALSGAVATAFSNAANPVLWAAARRVRHEPVHLSRIASVLAILIVVISLATAVWGLSAATQAEGPQSRADRPISVGWRGDPTYGLDAARDAFTREGKEVLIVPIANQDDTAGPMPPILDVDDCPGFVGFFGGDSGRLCTPGNEQELADFAEVMTGLRTPEANTRLFDGETLGGDAVIFSHEPLSVPDVQRVLGFLPAVNIDLHSSDLTAPLPLVQWLVAGALCAFFLLSIAIMREMGDRSVENAHRDLVLQRIGLSVRQSDRLAWLTFLIPLLVATVAAFACSLVVTYAGEVLQIAKGDVLRLALVAAVSLALPLATIVVTIPVRHASSLLTDR